MKPIALNPSQTVRGRIFLASSVLVFFAAGCGDLGTDPVPAPGPAVPTAGAPTGVSLTGFTATWSAVPGATGYRLDVSADSTFLALIPPFADLDVGAVTSFPVTGLPAGQRFYYRVRAMTPAGPSGSSNVVGVTLSSTVPQISFSGDVRPLFARHGCTNCHGGSGGLSVATVAALLAGGNSGPAVVPGDGSGSILIQKLLPAPSFGSRMPRGGPFLPDSSIALIRTWIDQGAQNN
jgi:hypothetical protein